LTHLQSLLLNYNGFSGTLPESVNGMTELRDLFLFGNKLAGTIPPLGENLSNLRSLSLGQNQFDGTLPHSLNYLPSLEVISVERDSRDVADDDFGIVGHLPPFHQAPKLREVYLGSNSLSGTIPMNFLSGVDNKTDTIQVGLAFNRIVGRIPANLAPQFPDMNLHMAGNYIAHVPSDVCESSWRNGTLADDCDAFLCPKGTYNQYGRKTQVADCLVCSQRGGALWYGSTSCGPAASESLSEKDILEQLFLSTNGPGWTRQTNWMDPDLSLCQWYVK
jgi:hypothetical protein